MTQLLFQISICLIFGLSLSRLAKKIQLPAVTAYLVAGLFLGPFFIGKMNIPMIGFSSLEDVEGMKIITQVALGFIAFTIGNEFRLTQLKQMGKAAITIGILQAVITTAVVDIALITLHFIAPNIISIPSAITLGAIASATAPAATLMVVKQYKANGPLTKLLLMVVAIDDAVGLILFAASFGIANALELGTLSVISVVVEPLIEIVGSLLLGIISGFILNETEIFFHSRSKRLTVSIAYVLLAVALSSLEFEVGGVKVGFSLLLVCMMTGTTFCNICSASEELMERTDAWTAPLNVLFFVLSGAELDMNVISNKLVLLVGIVYIIFRSAGKISGAFVSCKLSGCDKKVTDHLGITLLPQAGVALGMAVTAAGLKDGAIVRNVVLFSVLIYELVGPTLTKMALMRAGEIIPEGKTHARRVNENREKTTHKLHPKHRHI